MRSGPMPDATNLEPGLPEVLAATPDELDAILSRRADALVVLYMWGPDCPNCEFFATRLPGVLRALAGANVAFVKVDVYAHPELARRYGVYGIPSFMLFRDGRRIGKMSEFRGDAFFTDVIREHVPQSGAPMNTTLTTPPVAPLLSRLFADAEKSNQLLREMFGHLSREERAARMSDPNADYRAFYGMAKDIHMAVAPDTGLLLYMLARGNSARAVVEFGTSFGISTIHLAAALRDNGGGRLIGTEFEPGKLAHARANLQAAGLDDLVDIREGDALVTLAHDLPETVDVVLLDGHKALYAQVLALVAPRLRTGAYIVADNADACPEYLRQVRVPGSGYLSVSYRDDVELTMKL